MQGFCGGNGEEGRWRQSRPWGFCRSLVLLQIEGKNRFGRCCAPLGLGLLGESLLQFGNAATQGKNLEEKIRNRPGKQAVDGVVGIGAHSRRYGKEHHQDGKGCAHPRSFEGFRGYAKSLPNGRGLPLNVDRCRPQWTCGCRESAGKSAAAVRHLDYPLFYGRQWRQLKAFIGYGLQWRQFRFLIFNRLQGS